MSKPRTVRRVVTGHRADGRSSVLLDSPAPNVKQRQAGNASILLWVTEETPALVCGAGDAACRLGMVFIDAEEPAELAAPR